MALPERTDEELFRSRILESARNVDPVLKACLELAVPLWVERHQTTSPEAREKRAQELVEITAFSPGIAKMTEPRLRPGKQRKGQTMAEAFNAVAEGLGLLAYCPGGVTWGGCHWEVVPVTEDLLVRETAPDPVAL